MSDTPAPRPSTRDLAIWHDLRATLASIGYAELYLGFTNAKPRELDWDAARMHLQDARRLLGALALAHAENIEARS